MLHRMHPASGFTHIHSHPHVHTSTCTPVSWSYTHTLMITCTHVHMYNCKLKHTHTHVRASTHETCTFHREHTLILREAFKISGCIMISVSTWRRRMRICMHAEMQSVHMISRYTHLCSEIRRVRRRRNHSRRPASCPATELIAKKKTWIC